METKVINTKDLTSECWLIQVWGLKACETCEYSGTKECGGAEIRQNLITNGKHGKITETGLPNQA